MEYMDINYNVVGVVKSQLCSTIVQSENVREALDYKGSNTDEYDPEDPFTLIHNCVIPCLQYPKTVTTTEPLIFVGIKLTENVRNQYLTNAIATIICAIHEKDMRTTKGYFREDLLEQGCICYTKADWVADEIIKCISSLAGTWIGDIETIESDEYAMSDSRYARRINFRLKDVNIGKLMQNG